jgi:hypothetical protein
MAKSFTNALVGILNWKGKPPLKEPVRPYPNGRRLMIHAGPSPWISFYE